MFFTLLLFVSSAIPVFADALDSETVPQPSPQEAANLPDGPQVAEGLQETKEHEAEEQSRLETPKAEAEREESRTAYSADSPAEAEALLESQFSDQLAVIDQDPARALTDAKLEQILGPTEARIKVNGESLLVDGTFPVRVPNNEGDLAKVSLALQDEEGGLAPTNPISPVKLPEQVSEGIEVGGTDLSITPESSEANAQRMDNKDVFYANIEPDTDLAAMPISEGVELFSQLRSADSPEELRFQLHLPQRAELAPDGPGAKVTLEGRAVASIPAPTATDAQGANVPVSMSVDGNTLVLEVQHRGMEVAYPILVDPAIVDEWYSYSGGTSWYAGGSLAALSDGTWAYTSSDWGRFIPGTSPIYASFGGSNKGLFISAKSITEKQYPGHYGQWSYTAPGSTTWIAAAGVYPFWRNDHGCSPASYPEPHDYDGLWSPAWSPQYGWIQFQSNAASAYGQAFSEPPKDWREHTAQVYILGLGTGSSTTAANPCWRDLYAGGAYVWLSDSDVPSWVSNPSIADTWIDTSSLPVSMSAKDPGLGMKTFKLFTTDSSGKATTDIGSSINACSGLHANPCPSSWSSQITNYSPSSLPNGIYSYVVIAYDPFVEHYSQGLPVFIKTDHSGPVINTSGELLGAKPQKYHLEVDAVDGNSSALSTAQSGLKNVEFYFDNQFSGRWPETVNPPACSNIQQGINVGSCEFKVPLDLARNTSGKHSLKIIATDSLNHSTTKTLELNLPKDEVAPKVSASGPLFNLAGGWTGPNESTVTVQGEDAETGVVEEAVYVDNTRIGQPSLQECFYGGCSLSHTFSVPLKGYTQGPHTVKVVAKDGAGNTSESNWTINVDTSNPTMQVLGTTPTIPTEWTPQLTSVSVNYLAKDTGVGINKVELTVPGTSVPAKSVYLSSCTGQAGALCFQSAEGSTVINTAELPQGKVAVVLKSFDAFNNASGTQTVWINVDRKPPLVSVAGKLMQSSEGQVVGLNNPMELWVTDKGSGVEAFDLLIDGELFARVTAEEIAADKGQEVCFGEVCELKYTITAPIGDAASPGVHNLTVKVYDRAGHATSLSHKATLDAEVPELKLSGTLMESVGMELTESPAPLVISASDTGTYNSGIASIKVLVDEQNVDTISTCSSAPYPASYKATYLYDKSAWSAGPHDVSVVITDGAGNVVTHDISVDHPINAVAPDCPAVQPEILPTVEPLSATAAATAADEAIPGAVASSVPPEGAAELKELFDPTVTTSSTLSIDEQGLDMTGTAMGGGIETTSAGAFTVGQAVCLQPLQTTSAATSPTTIHEDSVIYANSAPSTDTVVRPTAFGTTIVEHLRGSSAPSEFSWGIDLEPGEELIELPNGSVAVVDPQGQDIEPEESSTGSPPPTELADVADVELQMERAGEGLVEANAEVAGEVKAVVEAPSVIENNGEALQGVLRVSSAEVVTAVLPPETVSKAVALVIEANPAAEPEDLCAQAFSQSPDLYPAGCLEEPDLNQPEPSESAEESVEITELQMHDGQLQKDLQEALEYGAGATASSEGVTGWDRAWCGANLTRAEYCAFFYEDKRFAVAAEAGLFNVTDADSTKGNAFRHSLWVALMVNSDPPDKAAIKFALNHERGQQKSKRRLTRYKSDMDVLNDWVGWKHEYYREKRDDLESCEWAIGRVGKAQFIDYNRNPYDWANKMSFEYFNVVYRRKYEEGVAVHLVGQNCLRGLYLGGY